METTKSIKGTRTEHNLLASFAGESQARSRYSLFAEKAKEEGYEQIAAVFLETAEQELSHARQFFSLLEGGTVEITAGYPAGVVGDTRMNLAEAPAESARNGATFMRTSPRLPPRRASRMLPTSTSSSPRWSRCTRHGISNSWSVSKAVRSSSRTNLPNGCAAAAVSPSMPRPRPSAARYAAWIRDGSSARHRITDCLYSE